MRKIQYQVTTLAEIRKRTNPDDVVAFDVETIGLYGTIAMAQFYQRDWPEALLVIRPDILELSLTLKDLHIVCHNTSYEVSTIQTQLAKALGSGATHRWLPRAWEDTLLLAKLHFFQQEKFALDDCYHYLFKTDIYAFYNLDKKLMHKADWSKLDEAKMTYGAVDVFYLLELYDACKVEQESMSYGLDKAATTAAFQFQTNGLYFDRQRVLARIEENNAKVKEIACPVNVNSYQQVRPYIGESTSDDIALATFALQGNERADQVRKARKLLKQNSFLNKFLDESTNDRIYGKFTFTTKSGRGNCKDQNLQQLPRSTKGMFCAPPGKVLVLSDFAQLELRMICAIANDRTMESLFKEGRDLHAYTVEMMGVPRQQAKTCNFNLTYGGSANMLQTIFIKDVDLFLPLGQIQQLKKKWHNLWQGITSWQEAMTSRQRRGGIFETVLGRRMTAKLYTDAMNLPIQGSSAEVSKLAMHRMFTELKTRPWFNEQVSFVNFVHDSFMWECPDDPDIYEDLAKITADAMQGAWNELIAFTAVPDLPMPVEVTVGKNWGDLEYEIETPIYEYKI